MTDYLSQVVVICFRISIFEPLKTTRSIGDNVPFLL